MGLLLEGKVHLADFTVEADLGPTAKKVLHKTSGESYVLKHAGEPGKDTAASWLIAEAKKNEEIHQWYRDDVLGGAKQNVFSPHLTPVLACWVERKHVYLLQPFLSPQTLWDIGGCSDTEVLRYMIDALDGAGIIHKRGYMHHDLKEENMLVLSGISEADRKQQHSYAHHLPVSLVITDFGHVLPKQDTVPAHAWGTLGQVSPDVLRKKFDPKADVFSLGATCYKLLCDVSPYPELEEKDAKTEKDLIHYASIIENTRPAWVLHPDHVSIDERVVDVVTRAILPKSTQRPSLLEARNVFARVLGIPETNGWQYRMQESADRGEIYRGAKFIFK